MLYTEGFRNVWKLWIVFVNVNELQSAYVTPMKGYICQVPSTLKTDSVPWKNLLAEISTVSVADEWWFIWLFWRSFSLVPGNYTTGFSSFEVSAVVSLTPIDQQHESHWYVFNLILMMSNQLSTLFTQVWHGKPGSCMAALWLLVNLTPYEQKCLGVSRVCQVFATWPAILWTHPRARNRLRHGQTKLRIHV